MARTGVFVGLALGFALTGCEEQNRFVAPPPPEVVVANPVTQPVTPYFHETGSVAAVNTVDLVARIPGFVQAIGYEDGAVVKKGTVLFTIEREPYKIKLDQAQAAEDGAKAVLAQSEAEYQRQADLVKRGVSTPANYDKALADRDNNKALYEQAQANTKLAAINYDYTLVTAPFDGVVTARLVSVGEYVGANNTPTKLASIVQIDPIYVNFNVSEQDVLRVRAARQALGDKAPDLKKVPVEIGLQNEKGYPHRGHIDYVAPTLTTSTGTLAARAVLANPGAVLLPGYFVRVRIPAQSKEAMLVPDTALGSNQAGRYVLTVNANNVVEQRTVVPGFLTDGMRVIESGLQPDDRLIVEGLLRAVPGQKVEPKMQSAAAPAK